MFSSPVLSPIASTCAPSLSSIVSSRFDIGVCGAWRTCRPNLLLTMLDKLGAHVDAIGDSTALLNI